MCADKNNDKNKTNLPPPSPTQVKLLSLLLWTFQTFSLFLLTLSVKKHCEKLSVIAWVDYFVLQICWRWVEKKTCF